MASKRPLRTTAYRGGKVVNHGRASSLHGAILSASRRLMMKSIAVIEILNEKEQPLAVIRWSYNFNGADNFRDILLSDLTTKGIRLLRKERSTARK